MRSTVHFSPENVSRWELLFSRKLEIEMVEAFEFFRSRGIEPLLIKGWAASRNYPPNSPRSYTDVDLAVDPFLFDNAKAAMASSEGSEIGVDLHRGLRHLDTKPWNELFDDSEIIEIDGYEIRIPCPEDHLRIMAVHWLNDGAERKDRLWDIHYAVENRNLTFDWELCLGPVAANRRYWIIAAIGLAGRYTGLDLSGLPFEREAAELPDWLIRAIETEWRLGIRQRSLHTCLRDPREFVRQLRKRLPPNPIQAAIEVDGDFRSRFVFPYQIKSMNKRLWPSIRGISHVLRSRNNE